MGQHAFAFDIVMALAERSDLGERWPPRLVATTSENCLRTCANHRARMAGREHTRERMRLATCLTLQ
jgi:hypothetical protein